MAFLIRHVGQVSAQADGMLGRRAVRPV